MVQFDAHPTPRARSVATTASPSPSSSSSEQECKPKTNQKPTWGRTSNTQHSYLRTLAKCAPGVIAPLFSLSCFLALAGYNGSLADLFSAATSEGVLKVLHTHGPSLTVQGTAAVAVWLGLQALLYIYLPGHVNTGQRTPAGHLLEYKTNGLSAWIVTHALFVVLCCAGIFAALSLAGWSVAGLAYVKALWCPSFPDDRMFSGCAFYDFYMGVELNPRTGQSFDWKFFSNGRPGLIAWTLVDISHIAHHYQTHQSLNLPLILVTALHTLYVLDFFVHEAWYLRTIDIAHDHYGSYLAWGCISWVPTMYTLHAQYLSLYPAEPSPSIPYQALVLGLGVAGYALFRDVNNQKDTIRRYHARGQPLPKIWNKPAEVIVAEYKTSDGVTHSSILLCSGWWGVSRHANYVGDLMLAFAMCAMGQTMSLLVWMYLVFMLGLLVHRCLRDEQRGEAEVWGVLGRVLC